MFLEACLSASPWFLEGGRWGGEGLLHPEVLWHLAQDWRQEECGQCWLAGRGAVSLGAGHLD